MIKQFYYLCYRRTQENEFNLLQFSKSSTSCLKNLKFKLSENDDYSKKCNTKTDLLREQLLTAENKFLQIKEKCDVLNYTIKGLSDEKKMLKKQYNFLPNVEVKI